MYEVGNRGSFVQVLAILLAVEFLRRRYFRFIVIAIGIAIILSSFYIIGERIDLSRGVGSLRILSLVSKRVAEASGAVDTSDWRMMRWQRAINEIIANPLFGKGYGGVENAWVFADISQFEDARIEVDLATGGIHNGFISCAYSLGIPALIIFLFVYLDKIWCCFKFSEKLKYVDEELSEFCVWTGANLIGLVLAIYIGADLNAPIIWFYTAMAIYLIKLAQVEAPLPQPVPVIAEQPIPQPAEQP